MDLDEGKHKDLIATKQPSSVSFKEGDDLLTLQPMPVQKSLREISLKTPDAVRQKQSYDLEEEYLHIKQ